MFKSDEVFYKICFDSLIEGICIANKEGQIVMINAATEDIFGYEKEELVGQPLDMLIPQTLRKIHREHLKAYLKNPRKYKKGKGREFLGLHKNGSILDLEIGLNYFDHEGSLYVKALISEISTRKKHVLRIKERNRNLQIEVEQHAAQLMRVVAELEKSNLNLKEEIKERIMAGNRAKIAFEKEKEVNLMQTKFVSMASHEFKTPLSGILTSASLIKKYNEINPNEKIGKHAGTIMILVNQLNSILDDFLFLENTESENYTMRLSKFKFCDLISKLVTDANAILKEGQRIEINPCTETVEVWQDKKIIDIIIRNILYNAIKYSDTNSVIRMSIGREGELLIISIEDQGIGIPKDAQEHVFDRFYRAKNVLSIQGTGIGLNIAKRYVQKLNGTIKLQSEEHQGTKVTIELPITHQKLRAHAIKEQLNQTDLKA